LGELSRMHRERRMTVRQKQDPHGVEAEVFERQARICKAFANAIRLQMLDLLGKHDWAAADLQAQLGISKANLSQHVAILKAAGIVETGRKNGRVYCSLAMPEVKSACHLIRDVLRAQVRKGRRLTF
jgi:DNA-binding transcriptional ArsR family regulator